MENKNIFSDPVFFYKTNNFTDEYLDHRYDIWRQIIVFQFAEENKFEIFLWEICQPISNLILDEIN